MAEKTDPILIEIGNYVVKMGFVDKVTGDERNPGDVIELTEERAAEIAAAKPGLIAKIKLSEGEEPPAEGDEPPAEGDEPAEPPAEKAPKSKAGKGARAAK